MKSKKLQKLNMQLHAGEYSEIGESIHHAWHTNSEGTYWTGWIPHNVDPITLFRHAISLVHNLMSNHPELRAEMMNILLQVQFTGEQNEQA